MTKSSRFEYKFLVMESQARNIARELCPFMERDKWSQKQGTPTYIVSSLYLDSPGLHCYEAVEQGARNRFKLRMRWYAKGFSQPHFLEEKRRSNDAISKIRVPINEASAKSLLYGANVTARDLTSESVQHRASAETLLQRFAAIQGGPVCVVRYEREAWESSRFPGLRVTFDREVRAVRPGDLLGEEYPVDLPKDQTILEIKFRDQVPEWLTSLVRRYRLYRTSVPKYVLCVNALRDHGISFSGLRRGFVAPGRFRT